MKSDKENTKNQKEEDNSVPLLDLNQSSIKKLISQAKTKGYLTYSELNETMPPGEMSSEQIEDIMTALSEMGITLIESDEEQEEKQESESLESEGSKELVAASSATDNLDRTDDPVRMYLREMGSVELLSREGEIAIAKRIEAGRNTYINGLCESPLTFQAITIWRKELLDEKIMLRDVIDLDATFGSISGEELNTENNLEKFENSKSTSELNKNNLRENIPGDIKNLGHINSIEEEDKATETLEEDENDDFEEDQANVSLAAMENSLKPQVLNTLKKIADAYSKLSSLQKNRMLAALKEKKQFSGSEEKKYQNLRNDIVELVNSLHLHNNRVEALIDQLYGINRKIMSLDGSLVKMADKSRINRKEFIEKYKGSELDPIWLENVSKLKTRGWENFVENFGDKIDEIRNEIAEIGQYIGIDISEFRRIVQQVQKGEKEARSAKKRDGRS